MDINQVQQRIVDDFNQFDDWMDKYALLIELGNGLHPIDEKYKVPQNIIEGCQSRVWLMAEMENGLVYYKAESDAILVKGIVALLLEVFSGRTPDEILNAELIFIERIGLREHLSPTRSNGLLAMIRQIRLYALALKSKSTKH